MRICFFVDDVVNIVVHKKARKLALAGSFVVVEVALKNATKLSKNAKKRHKSINFSGGGSQFRFIAIIGLYATEAAFVNQTCSLCIWVKFLHFFNII